MRHELVSVEDGELSVSPHGLVAAILALYGLALAVIAIASWVPPLLTAPVITVAVSVVPGALLMTVLSDERELGAVFVVYSIGVSLMMLMVLGLALNLVLPPIGIDQPLSFIPIIVSITVLVLALALLALRFRRDVERTVAVPTVLHPIPISVALVSMLCALGILLLGRFGNNAVLVVALILVAFIPLAGLWVIDSRWHGYTIWVVALGVLYHASLTPGHTFPGNPVVIRIARSHRWVPGVRSGWDRDAGGPLSTELLQHGTIFPMFAQLNGIDIMTQMIAVNPFFISLIPLVLFLAFRNYVRSDLAFLGAAIFMFSHPFIIQYPTAGRVATPVLFLSLFALAISDSTVSRPVKTVLAQLFVAGIVFTHYGTSYFSMVAFVGGFVLLMAFGLFDTLTGGTARTFTEHLEGLAGGARRSAVLALPFIGFFVILTLSWFLVTNAGRGFALFPRHMMGSIEQLTAGALSRDGGRTGARLQRDYGSATIDILRYLYMALAAFIAIGLAATLSRRAFSPGQYDFDDEFVAIAIVMLGLFGTTIIVRTWGGGRPMMITFVFTLVFAIVGVSWLAGQVDRFAQTAPSIPRVTATHVYSLFAISLAVLFLLNSGVVVAIGVFDDAPRTTPASDGSTQIDYDIATHAWMIDHNAGFTVYGDHVAHGQTDWIAPAITAHSEQVRNYGPERPRNQLEPLMEPGVRSGYLLLLSHNTERGALNRYGYYQPIDDVRHEYREHAIYTSGDTVIYYINGSAESMEED